VNVDTGEFKALAARVNQLAADLERYAQDAATIRSFDELCLPRLDHPARPAVSRSRRPRHLHLVGGSS